MANVPLKSLKFPGLDNTYTIPQIDSSLTQEGYAADAKAVHDAVASADSEIAYVPFDTKVTIVDLVPTDDSWFIRKGYIRHAGLSSVGQISANNSYTTYCFKARQNMLITGCDFPNYDANHWGCVRISNEQPASGVGNPWTGNLYDSITGNIPTSEAPATVLKGQWVAVHYYRTGAAGDAWTLHLQETGAKVLQPDIPLTPAMLSYVDNLTDGTVKYGSAQTLSNVQKAQARENIGAGEPVMIDDTLTVEGAAADAKKAGEKFALLESAMYSVPISKIIPLTSGGRYIFSKQKVGESPVRETGTGKYAVIDVSYAKNGGTIELTIDAISSNSTVSTVFTDENDIVLGKYVTSQRFILDDTTNSYKWVIDNPQFRKLYFSIYGGSDSLTVKLTPAKIGQTPYTVYVSASGSDGNLGNVESAPLATIKKALEHGAKNIVLLTDLHESVSVADATVSISGGGHTVYADSELATEAYSGILRAPYAADTRITNCFVNQTTPLTESVSGSSWKGDKYNICVYADDERLLPVADVESCLATENSFTWAEGYFYINAGGSRYAYVLSGNVFSISGGKVTLNDVRAKHAYNDVVAAADCTLEMNGCAVIGSVNGNCVSVNDSALVARKVEAAKCWNDGINTHGRGNSTLIDCFCHDCSDDGVSQHDSATGTVHGGEFCACGKGGISSPINSAKVDIYDAYCHDNDYGIYASSSSGTATQFKIFGCVVKANRIGLKIAGHTALTYHNLVAGNTTNTQTESGGSIVDLSA